MTKKTASVHILIARTHAVYIVEFRNYHNCSSCIRQNIIIALCIHQYSSIMQVGELILCNT